jgi:uncharacterized protein
MAWAEGLFALKKVLIFDAYEKDYPAIVKLNDVAVEFTSPMDLKRLSFLASLAAYFRVAVTDDQVVAFLLAMKDGAPYQNDNYAWFSSRYQKFLYIDRVVVAGEFQGRGIGTQLYRDIISYARQEEIPIITCEINAVPPNDVSTAFHARLGFSEVGSQWICNGQKKVSMQALFTA